MVSFFDSEDVKGIAIGANNNEGVTFRKWAMTDFMY